MQNVAPPRALLDFHKQILTDIMSEANNLLIMAQGLGLENYIVPSVMRAFSADKQLVFVVNYRDVSEFEYYQQLIPSVKYITSSGISQEDRRAMYSEGGIFFVTTRILTVDFLKNQVGVDKVAGLIVLHAER